MRKSLFLSTALLCILPEISGCTHAPILNIGGSFFPSWMICLAIGIACAAALHLFLRHRNLHAGIGLPHLFYPALALFFSCLLWLILFR